VLSPMMTVAVLVVLWLIVVVPMVLRRSDERRRERTVDGFGRAMRALGRRPHSLRDADVFVPAEHRVLAEPEPEVTLQPPSLPTRRPVPAAQESLMHPVDRAEMSEARTAMMRRRRRSLGILGAGSVVFTLAALVTGGLVWLLAALFLTGLSGYLLFLRSQAMRDRERRAIRLQRAVRSRPAGYEATAQEPAFAAPADSVVRIDDDDIELHSMDTIDLTGVYSEDLTADTAARRAS